MPYRSAGSRDSAVAKRRDPVHPLVEVAELLEDLTGRTTACRLVMPPCQWIVTITYSLSRST